MLQPFLNGPNMRVAIIPLYRRDKIRVRYIYIWVKRSPAGQQYPEYLLNRDLTRSLARSTDWQGTFERAKLLV